MKTQYITSDGIKFVVERLKDNKGVPARIIWYTNPDIPEGLKTLCKQKTYYEVDAYLEREFAPLSGLLPSRLYPVKIIH